MAEISVSWVSIRWNYRPIFIDHSDGIFARFNGNVDGIKWQSVNSSEQNGQQLPKYDLITQFVLCTAVQMVNHIRRNVLWYFDIVDLESYI